MARGMLAMPAPPVPAAFDVEQMYFEPDRWWSPVPPGWPGTLAVGVALGAPWLVNPILGGVNVLLAFLVLLDLYGRRTARLGVILLALSPWYVFLAMSFMTHAATLLAALLAAVGVIKARRTGRTRWGFIAGCALGYLVLIRPLDAVIVAGCLTRMVHRHRRVTSEDGAAGGDVGGDGGGRKPHASVQRAFDR